MSLDVRRINPSDIGITLEEFKRSPHFLGKDKFKPPKDLLGILRKDVNTFENEYFEKVASSCIFAADALTNNMISRLYWFVGGMPYFANLITWPRYHLIKEAIYMEISWRCISGKIPETYNRTILANANGVNIVGNERDFLITEQFLSPVALRTLLNAGLEDFISTLDTDKVTDQVVLLSDWKEAKDSLTSSIQSNARSISSVSNVANQAKSKADDAARDVENNKGNINNNRSEITRIDNLANSINSDLQETKNQVNTNKRNITTKQNKLPDSNGAKLIKVSNDTVTYESVNIAQDTNFIQVKNKLAEMENKAEEIKTSLDQNVQTTQEIKSDIDNLNTELTEAQKRTETVAKNLGKSNLRIQALERSGGGAGGGIQLPNSDGPKLINVNDNVVTYEKINIAKDEDFIKIKDRIDGVENKSSQNEESVHYLGGLIGDLNTNKQDRLRDSNGAKLIKVNDYGAVSYVEPEFQGISEKVDLIDWKVDRCEDSLYSKQNKLPNSNGAKLIKVENGAITYEDPANGGGAGGRIELPDSNGAKLIKVDGSGNVSYEDVSQVSQAINPALNIQNDTEVFTGQYFNGFPVYVYSETTEIGREGLGWSMDGVRDLINWHGWVSRKMFKRELEDAPSPEWDVIEDIADLCSLHRRKDDDSVFIDFNETDYIGVDVKIVIFYTKTSDERRENIPTLTVQDYDEILLRTDKTSELQKINEKILEYKFTAEAASRNSGINENRITKLTEKIQVLESSNNVDINNKIQELEMEINKGILPVIRELAYLMNSQFADKTGKLGTPNREKLEMIAAFESALESSVLKRYEKK